VAGTLAINTKGGRLAAYSTGNGGAIALSTAGGNITTSALDSASYGTGRYRREYYPFC
jgi:hypothetical protein